MADEHRNRSLGLCLASLALLLLAPLSAVAGDPIEIAGRVAIRVVNCFSPAPHDQADDLEYFVVDGKSNIRTKLAGDAALLGKLKPNQSIRVKGSMRPKAKAAGAAGGLVANLGAELDTASIEIVDDHIAAAAAPVAQAAPTMKMLRCLLVFATSKDNPCLVTEANARGRLFNNTNNANLGMQSLTKGHFGLQLGNGSARNPIVHMQLNVNSSGQDANSMEDLMLTALSNLGYNRDDYDRVLLFPPAGIPSFTAYANLGEYTSGTTTDTGMVSVYGSTYGNNYMSGYLHELGHGFGLHHASKGASQYGDGTCVMGVSHGTTDSENYNVVKLLETNWLTPFPGAHVAVSSDTTLDLYSLHQDPNTTSGAMAVSIPGTPYFVSYRVDSGPYARLRNTGDRNRVFVYTGTGLGGKSFQVANLDPGQTFTGTGALVTFENYGPNNSFARVSIDLPPFKYEPTVTWTTASQASVGEDGTMTVTAQLSKASGKSVNIPFTVTGTSSGTDRTITASPITIAAGATTGTATITILQDAIAEPNETVILTMGASSNVNLGATTVHTATITDDDVGQPTVAWTTASQASVGESGSLTVTAQLSASSAQIVTVPFTVTGTAAGTDYTIIASPITIPAGATTGTATITIMADTLDEANETVILTLLPPTNAHLSPGTTVHTAVIADDDASPTVTWTTANQASVGESGILTVTVQLSAASGQIVTVPLTYSGTADFYYDWYPILFPFSIIINPGAMSGTVTFTITEDVFDEANETVILNMGIPTNATVGATTVHTATITDDDATPTVSWTAASQSTGESGTMTVTAQLSAASGQPVTVPFTVTGTASGADRTITSTLITIAAKATTGTAIIAISSDTISEANETVILTMYMPTNATVGAIAVHTATIVDDDSGLPTVSWTAGNQISAGEAGTMTVTARLSATSGQNVTVPFTVTGTTSIGDWSITASPITIPAGATTGTATITITADVLDEANETVILNMGTPTNASLGATTVHTATITDDDAVPTVSWTTLSQSSIGETGTMMVTAQLSAISGRDVRVFTGVAGTALAEDRTLSLSIIDIPAGATTGTGTITITEDVFHEANETVIVSINYMNNATLGATTVHTATIMDDDADAKPTVTWTSASQPSVFESGTMTVTAKLSAVSGQSVTVPFTVSGTSTAADRTISASPITIAAGATSSNATITITADTLDEPNETVILTMGTPTNATLGATTVHTATITDDDATTYTVTYNGNGNTGGTVPASQTKTHGTNLTLATNSGALVKAGSTFAGWNTAANGSGTDYAAGATYTANAAVTLYAKWTLDTYTVTYSGNGNTGGTAPANQTKTHGVNLTLATNSGALVKTGSTFAGWNTAANGSGTNYATGATYTTNAAVTLYAKWTLNTAPAASNSSISTSKNTAVSGVLQATDAQSNPLTFSIVANGAKGSAVITNAASGAFTYTPNTNQRGTDTFTFRANDGSLNSNTATVTVTINGTLSISSAPSATPNPASTDDMVLFTVAASGSGTISYLWDFGDGSSAAGASTSHKYSAPGNYTVTVTVSEGGETVTGSVSVSVVSPSTPPVNIRVNFQLAGATTPSGYLPDTGGGYGNRGNGYSYGWNTDNSTTARDRNAANSPDQRYDTLQHMQKPANPNAVWEIAVPNGQYSVRVVAGDPSYFDSVYRINVEGVQTVSATPTATSKWFEGTTTVTVGDGRLTVSNGAGAANNKICFVEINNGVAARELAADVTEALPLTVEKLQLAMNFTGSGRDSYRVAGVLADLPVDINLQGLAASIDVGAAIADFTLDAKGRARSKNGTFIFKYNTRNGWIFQASIKKGAWLEAWSDGGLENTTVSASAEVPVTLTLGDQTFGGSKNLNYKAKANKSGQAR